MQRLSATRAMKNARHIQLVAPAIFPAAEPSDGFFSVVPFEILDRFHHLSDAELQQYPGLFDSANRLRGDNRQTSTSESLTSASLVQSIFGSDPFVGMLHFLRITFNVGGNVVVLSTTDVTTILQYALLAVPVIADYARQYGENDVAVSTDILELTVDLPSATYNDDMVRAWVRQALSEIYAPNKPDAYASMHCIVVLNPDGVVNVDATAGIGGYHQVVPIPIPAYNSPASVGSLIPYCFVNVTRRGFTIRDDARQYSTALSHEIAEMIVDWPASWPNPEICDPCASNCLPGHNSSYLSYFVVTSTGSVYVGGDNESPYDFYIAAIAHPSDVHDCPAPYTGCNYGPDARTGISELLFYEQADGYGELYSVDSATRMYLQTIHRDWGKSWSLLVPAAYMPPGSPLGLLSYDSSAGVGQFYNVGNLGDMNRISTSSGWRTSWSIIVSGKFSDSPYTDLLFYDPSTGAGEFYHTENGQLGPKFAAYTGWLTTWTIIVPGKFSDSQYTDLLFYDPGAGVGQFYHTGGGLVAPYFAGYTGWPTTWSMIIPGKFSDSPYTDLLFYDPSTGLGEFYSTGDGLGARFAAYSDWRPSWSMIIPGKYSNSPYTDLLFYDPSAGAGEFYSTGGGLVELLAAYSGWRTWSNIVRL